MHNQKKDNNKFENKKQLELTENQTVWKSDNQGIKEETSSRLVGGAETGSQAERTRGKAVAGEPARQQIADWAVPHSRAHNREEQMGSKTNCIIQGSSAGK